MQVLLSFIPNLPRNDSLLSPYSKMVVVQVTNVEIQVERTLPGKSEEKVFFTDLF